MRHFFLILPLALLTGCVAQQQAENFESTLQDFYASSPDEVVFALGAPDARTDTENGEVLTYRGEAESALDSYTFRCRIDFKVVDGAVEDIQYRGRSTHPYYGHAENCGQVYGGRQ